MNTEETTITDSTTEPITCEGDDNTKCIIFTTETPTTTINEGKVHSFHIF